MFTNGTTIDADQHNQNFTDIINGTSDGTKDFSVSALTVGGTLTANGSVGIGNSTADDLTVTASLASTVSVKTNSTYNFGSATLGMLSYYIGGTSTFTTRLLGAATATWTFTLPATAGLAYQVLKTNGSGTADWVPLAGEAGAGADADTTLTVASARTQVIVPTVTRAYTLPTTSVVAGETFKIVNNAANGSGFNITIKSSDADTLVTCYPQTSQEVVALQATPTDATHWRILGAIQPKSMIRMNTGGGHGGASATRIRCFSSTTSTAGSDITYTSNASNSDLGDKFTINADGVYAISYTDFSSNGCMVGISLNASSLTTDVGDLAVGQVLALQTLVNTSARNTLSTTVSLVKGDIIRAQDDSNANGATNDVQFTITQLFKY